MGSLALPISAADCVSTNVQARWSKQVGLNASRRLEISTRDICDHTLSCKEGPSRTLTLWGLGGEEGWLCGESESGLYVCEEVGESDGVRPMEI
jgi:hypothetical protein